MPEKHADERLLDEIENLVSSVSSVVSRIGNDKTRTSFTHEIREFKAIIRDERIRLKRMKDG